MIRDRIQRWVLAGLSRYWVTWLMMAILLSAVIYSIQAAGWIKDNRPLITCLLLGIGFGWLLARSRFHPAFAAAYALLISAFFALESVAHLLPAPADVFTRSFGALVNAMNIRAVALSLRAGAWVETLRAGKNVQDSGLFVLLLGMLLFLCAIWLMWFYLRQKRALTGLLPLGFLLAVNVHLSQQPLFNFLAFLLAGLLLVARGTFIEQQEDWQRRRVDFSDQLGLEWGGVALTMALTIVVAARLVSFFGSGEGWRVLADWAARSEEQTSDTATRLFSGVHPPPPALTSRKQILVSPPDLGQIGRPIPQGSETVMWVRTSDPLPAPPGAGSRFPLTVARTHYWRSGIYGAYTGRGWAPLPQRAEPTPPRAVPAELPPGRYVLRQDFELLAGHVGALFAVNEPVEVSAGASLRAAQGEPSLLVEGRVSRYQVLSLATRVTGSQLSSAPARYPPQIATPYLALPDRLPERVRRLARRVAGGEPDPYHKAMAIQNYLRENYPYDPQVPLAPPHSDVVDDFLFETQRGFCSHYASAMAVMLRAVGVPARVATGYAMGDFDAQRGAFRVPESAAHAWVEVYFPGYGWVEFEPTVARALIAYPETDRAPQASLPAGGRSAPAQGATPVYWIPLVALLALALLAAPFWLLRLFTASRQAPAAQIDLLYRRMRRALGWAGLVDRPNLTPDEYLALYTARLAPYAQLWQALQQATAVYRESVFSAHALDPARVRLAGHLWRRSLRDWLGLWLSACWNRLRGEEKRSDHIQPRR